jgi:hypothetical protein
MSEAKIETIKEVVSGMHKAFRRASDLTPEALGIWGYALSQYTISSIRKAAFTWVRTNEWPPTSLSEFERAVRGKPTTPKDKVLDGFLEWKQARADEGCASASYSTQGFEYPKSEGRKTPPGEVSVHSRLVSDIMDGRVSFPDLPDDEAEDKWYWAEFRNRIKRRKS